MTTIQIQNLLNEDKAKFQKAFSEFKNETNPKLKAELKEYCIFLENLIARGEQKLAKTF
jgi:hypothetical protein